MPVHFPRVAVLLAAYNGMQWIEEQLASILAQTDVDVTVYINIDPSTDGTEAWCAASASRHSNVVVLPPAGRFGGASRNFFWLLREVDFTDFDFVAFADQDDLWHPDKLSRGIDAINVKGVDAYSSNVTAFWPDGRACLLSKAQPQVTWDFLFEAAGPGCTYVFTQALAKALKASMFDHWHALQAVSLHDWFCYAFARSHGYRWFIDPSPSMNYRQHERNQVGANAGLSSLVARYKTIHDGWWFHQVQLITHLVGQAEGTFVRGWIQLGRLQLVRLSWSAWKCRRRLRDKAFFFCICWVTALIGTRTK